MHILLTNNKILVIGLLVHIKKGVKRIWVRACQRIGSCDLLCVFMCNINMQSLVAHTCVVLTCGFHISYWAFFYKAGESRAAKVGYWCQTKAAMRAQTQ